MDTRKIVRDQFDPIKIKNTYGHSQPIIKTHFSNVKNRIPYLLMKRIEKYFFSYIFQHLPIRFRSRLSCSKHGILIDDYVLLLVYNRSFCNRYVSQ